MQCDHSLEGHRIICIAKHFGISMTPRPSILRTTTNCHCRGTYHNIGRNFGCSKQEPSPRDTSEGKLERISKAKKRGYSWEISNAFKASSRFLDALKRQSSHGIEVNFLWQV